MFRSMCPIQLHRFPIFPVGLIKNNTSAKATVNNTQRTRKKPQSTTFPKEITQFFKTGDDLSLELKTALV